MRRALFLILGLCAACSSDDEPAPVTTPGANVILVVVDTLRADVLEPWGGDPRTSPNISRWAREGTVFTDCRAASPWTLPSMASILTGLYPRSHGAQLSGIERRLFADEGREADPITAALPRPSRVPPRLPEGLPTIAETFKKNGYATWMIASNPFVGYGLQEHFSFYSNHVQPAGVLVESARYILKRAKKRPFFLVMHFIDTHATQKFGIESLKKELDAFAGEGLAPLTKENRSWPQLDDDPEVFHAELEPRRRMYAVTTRFVDRHLGRLWRLVQDEERPTYLVITSDHGEDFRDHWDTDRASGHTDPRREWQDCVGFGHGHNLHRAVTHVPLLVLGPGIPAGVRVDQRVGLVDVYPTLCELADLAPPAGLQGTSLVPLALGESLPARPYLAESIAYGREKQAFFKNRWLLIQPESETEKPQLFDLENDIHERQDLAHERPDIVQELERELRGFVGKLPRRDGELRTAKPGEGSDLGDLGYAGDDD